MPVVFDEESGTNRVILNPLLTIDEAVIILLGKSLVDYPFVYYDEFGNHEETYVLEDYLQLFYDNGEEDLASKGLDYHELLLDAIDSRKLNLLGGRVRANKLILWALSERIKLADKLLMDISFAKNLRAQGVQALQEQVIIDEITKLGHVPLSLPPNPTGRDGVKAELRSSLDGKGLFSGTTVFEKAWERLRKKGRIKDQ